MKAILKWIVYFQFEMGMLIFDHNAYTICNTINGPEHEDCIRIVLASNKGVGETAQKRSLVTAFAARKSMTEVEDSDQK